MQIWSPIVASMIASLWMEFRCRDVHSCLYRRGTLPHSGQSPAWPPAPTTELTARTAALATAPELKMGHAPSARHRPAPVPGREGLRNLGQVRDVPADQQLPPGARVAPGFP